MKTDTKEILGLLVLLALLFIFMPLTALTIKWVTQADCLEVNKPLWCR